MDTLEFPLVVHWIGEPEPQLSGISQPLVLPFELTPAAMDMQDPPNVTLLTERSR